MHVQLNLPFISETTLDSRIILNTDPRFKNALDKFRDAEYFAIDCETYIADHDESTPTTNDALAPFRNQVRTIQIGLPDHTVLLCDFGGYLDDRDDIYRNLNTIAFMEILREKAKNIKVPVIGHNLYFDISTLYHHYGVRFRQIRDTMIISRFYYAGLTQRDGIAHNLGAVAKRELGIEVDKSYGKESNWGLPLNNDELNYCHNDVILPLQIYRRFQKYLKLKSSKYKYSLITECNVVSVLAEASIDGFPVNIDLVHTAIEQYEMLMDHVITPFKKSFPEIEPTASPETLINAFISIGCDIKVENAVYDKSGMWLGQPEKLLLPSKKDGDRQDFQYYVKPFEDIPEVRAVLDWRTYNKHWQYLINMVKNCRNNNTCHGSYTSFTPKGTGRSSCGAAIKKGTKSVVETGINLQNPAKPISGRLATVVPLECGFGRLISIRECFEAPKGRKLIVSDLPQCHMYIATEASQDKALLQAYKENIDQHSLVGATLAKLNGYDWDWKYILANKETNEKCFYFRHLGKTKNYSALNGAGAAKIALTNNLTLEVAKQLNQAHEDTFQGLHAFLRSVVYRTNHCDKNDPRIKLLDKIHDDRKGYVGTTPNRSQYGIAISFDERELIMKKFHSEQYNTWSVYPSECYAFTWLACEATIIKQAMIKLQAWLDSHPEVDARIVNLAHDEVNIDVSLSHAHMVGRKMHMYSLQMMKKYIKSMPIKGDLKPMTPEKRDKLIEKTICNSWVEK